jgi:aminopeptidase N
MKHRLFKYYPEDFGELTVDVLHMDLFFDVYDDRTNVKSVLRVRTKDKPLEKLELNGRDLEIRAVSCTQSEISYRYRKNDAILEINFGEEIPPHTEIAIVTDTVCRPTKNVLEGLYYDETPAGAPPQQITQCQQWGFQRIVPCIDDMTAKCTYRTVIIADSRYTNLITNGDIVVERHNVKPGRDKVVYDNTITPMATYLFFVGVGTYDTFKREFEYADGETFILELLVPPGSNITSAEKALEILHDAVMWVYLFTGPEQFDEEKLPVRNKLWELVQKREKIKFETKSKSTLEELQKLREEIAELDRTISPGYRYTGTVYREIGMQNSDFGGMENVGNTTISTNRIMPFPQMTDQAFEYMIRAKVHEYYHNQNGSEVTGKNPFEIWLNEAVTWHVHEQYNAFLFGEDYQRLGRVLELLSPGSGTFALDSGASSMSIIPDGFNDPTDFMNALTFLKASEYVQMVETLIGKDTFAQGLDLYFRRFRHSNAGTQDWITAMEEVSGQPLKEMSETWLRQKEFPVVEVSAEYDGAARKFTLFLKQQFPADGKPWEFPIKVALVDKDGKDLAEILEKVKEETTEIIIENMDMPAFLSLNRGYSFYGKVIYDASQEELLLQVRKDKDIIGRFKAFYTLVDREKHKLLRNSESKPSEEFVELYYRLLNDRQLLEKAGGQFLTIFESVEDEEFAQNYQALYDVRQKLLEIVASRYKNSIISVHQYFKSSAVPQNSTFEEIVRVIKVRQAKNACLDILATLDTPDIHTLIKQQFETATCATDRLNAFAAYLNCSAPDKIELLRSFETESKQSLVAWEAFLFAIGSNSSADTVELVREMERSKAFRIEQGNDQRALYGSFAHNRKKSLQTEEGRALFVEILRKLIPVNEYNTINLLDAFANIDQMEIKYHVQLVKVLANLLEEIDAQKYPSVYNRIKQLLFGAPKAVKKYTIEYGEIQAV